MRGLESLAAAGPLVLPRPPHCRLSLGPPSPHVQRALSAHSFRRLSLTGGFGAGRQVVGRRPLALARVQVSWCVRSPAGGHEDQSTCERSRGNTLPTCCALPKTAERRDTPMAEIHSGALSDSRFHSRGQPLDSSPGRRLFVSRDGPALIAIPSMRRVPNRSHTACGRPNPGGRRAARRGVIYLEDGMQSDLRQAGYVPESEAES